MFLCIFFAGRLCTIPIDMCECEPEACTLLRYGLWPATAEKPQTAFSIPLLELFVCLPLEGQFSVEGFCNTLRWRNNLTLTEVSQIAEVILKSHLWCQHFRSWNIKTKSKSLRKHLGSCSCMKEDCWFFIFYKKNIYNYIYNLVTFLLTRLIP